MLRYLYCVVPSDATPDLHGWAGEGAPLSLIVVDGIAGVVGAVDEAAFGRETLDRALLDVGAIAPYAQAHQDVVQFVFEHAPAVVPLAFGSVHASDDAARRSLEKERSQLLALLHRFRGMQEWGLRLARRRARVPVAAGETGAGTAYLATRRADLRGELDATARRAAEELDRALDAESGGRRVLAEASADLVFRAAYLVPAGRVDVVKRIVLERGHDLERVGLGAELSGPWPPYSFVESVQPQ